MSVTHFSTELNFISVGFILNFVHGDQMEFMQTYKIKSKIVYTCGNKNVYCVKRISAISYKCSTLVK